MSGQVPARLLLKTMRERSEEHTSELQSPCNLVCRLLLAKKYQGDDVRINSPAAGNKLDFTTLRKRSVLVAKGRSLFVSLLVGRAPHALLQATYRLVLPALQKQLGAPDIFCVIRLVNQARTRAGTTLDLVQQAGTGTIGEYRVLAGAQTKNFLHQPNAFPNRAGVGKWPEVTVGLVQAA